MSGDNDNPLAGLGSVLSSFGQAAEATRDVESARTVSPPRSSSPVARWSPPPARRSPSPPSFNYTRIENRPSHHYSTNYTSTRPYSGSSNADYSDTNLQGCVIIATILGIMMLGFFLWSLAQKTR